MIPEKLQAARFLTIADRPYLATALYALHAVEVDRVQYGGFATLGVDKHWRLYYDKVAIEKWSVPQLAGVLYHEIRHLLQDHHHRQARKVANPRIWNCAADMAINCELKNEKVSLPPGGVYPSSYDFPDGELVEQYYERLMEKHEGGGGFVLKIDGPAGGECGSCAGGEGGPWELGAPSEDNQGVSEAAGELIRLKTAEDIVAELESGKSRGTVPGSLELWAKEKLKPKVDWRRVLGSLVRQTVADIAGLVDYSYSKPARRQSVSNGIIMPALRHPLPLVAVVIDTSGSMSAHELSIAVTEVGGILKKIGLRDGLTVIPVDAAVHSCKKVFSPNQIQLAGGGGTDMGVGIAKAAALRPKPAACVLLTDGYTPYPSEAPLGMKVVVAIIGEESAGWSVPSYAKKIIIPKEALTSETERWN